MQQPPDRLTYLDQLSGVLECVPDAVVVVDADGTIAFANRNAETMLGYSRPELEGMLVEALLPKQLRATHARQRREYASAPVMRPMETGLELIARRKDGTEIPVEISLGPVYTDDRLLVIATVRALVERDMPVRPLVGDELLVGGEGEPARTGTIIEVLPGGAARPGYLVRWENGRESVFYPGAGITIRRGNGPRS